MAISARQLAKLIGVAERSIHRAEQTGNLGVKISLAMELLLTRLQHGEIDLPSSLDAPPRMGRPPSVKRSLVVEEPGAEYVVEWHGKMSTGADIRRWRRSVGLWQKDLAVLLGVHATQFDPSLAGPILDALVGLEQHNGQDPVVIAISRHEYPPVPF